MNELSNAASVMGQKGGKAGTGDAKRRSSEHYKSAARARWERPEILSQTKKSKTYAERLWSRVNKAGPIPTHKPELGNCWMWLGHTDKAGYGRFKIRADYETSVHRVSWALTNGPIPEGICVLHHCDNPSCLRPEHLFLGTLKDNVADSVMKGRRFIPKGESHPMSKLSNADVKSIREMATDPTNTTKKIADTFGISTVMVRYIKRRKNWSHI